VRVAQSGNTLYIDAAQVGVGWRFAEEQGYLEREQNRQLENLLRRKHTSVAGTIEKGEYVGTCATEGSFFSFLFMTFYLVLLERLLQACNIRWVQNSGLQGEKPAARGPKQESRHTQGCHSQRLSRSSCLVYAGP